MKIPFDKEWIVIEREDYANYLFVAITWEQYTKLPKSWGFRGVEFHGAEYINSACNLFALKEAFEKSTRANFTFLFTNPAIWDRLHRRHRQSSEYLFHLSRRIKQLPVRQLAAIELVRWMNRFQQAQADVHDPRGVMWYLETPENLVTNYLNTYLEEKRSDVKHVSIPPYEAFRLMATPLKPSIWAQEKEALARIGLEKKLSVRSRRLQVHTQKYEWLEYGLQGKVLGHDYFIRELAKILRRGAGTVLRELQQERLLLQQRQRQVIREYRIHPKHVRIFKIVQESTYLRMYSKDAQFYGYYCLEPMLMEIGRRAGLSLEQMRFLAPEDFRQALINQRDFSHITSDRQRYSIQLCHANQSVFFSGLEAQHIRKRLTFTQPQTTVGQTDTLKGQPAFNGKVKGRVKIINTIPEMVKMHVGNVLVSHMTNPGIVPVMKQASAIVTDLGGITCHAAIVARELKKPCVIGTRIATQVLRDGDMVEVDATRGIVEKI